jgi:hypothetical protein
MLLQCGMDGEAGEDARRAAWLGPATLESLAELNEMGLALLAEQAAAPAGPPVALLREVGVLWRTLDRDARRRAAAVPYLLLDGGFGDRERWRRGAAREVADPARGLCPAFFTVPGTIEVARLAFTYAWHLARAEGAAARLLLGMPSGCATLIAGCTLRHMHTLAERHPEWLRPRWPAQAPLWRELLLAAGSGEPRALTRARLHGLTMLAAEARRAAGRAPLTSPAGRASTAPSPRSPARP